MKSALLLSDSHIWGIWCYHALRGSQIAFEPILAEELDERSISNYRALIVPGGWSKNKLESLGEKGKELIRAFVERGGIYIGICGGASLAGLDGLSLVPVRRKKERVPSYSGPCMVNFISKTHLLNGISEPLFYLWFPPELEIVGEGVEVIATFQSPHPDAYTSDLCLKDYGPDWTHLEKLYNISLDPGKMKDKPLLFEASLGKGKLLLSLIHFDTPCCERGIKFLRNLADYYELETEKASSEGYPQEGCLGFGSLHERVFRMREGIQSLLEFGMRNFLFHRRYPFFLQWKRGIRGLELINLHYIFEELYTLITSRRFTLDTLREVEEILSRLEADLEQVLGALKKSYILKRLNTEDPDFIYEESLIFGDNLKSYGGLYRELINGLEKVLCYLWRDGLC